jgi:hypothetical protein
MLVQHHELIQWQSRGTRLPHNLPQDSNRTLRLSPTLPLWAQHMMRYYKPLVYSAIAIVYASFAFRVGRLGLLSRALKPRTEAKKQST